MKHIWFVQNILCCLRLFGTNQKCRFYWQISLSYEKHKNIFFHKNNIFWTEKCVFERFLMVKILIGKSAFSIRKLKKCDKTLLFGRYHCRTSDFMAYLQIIVFWWFSAGTIGAPKSLKSHFLKVSFRNTKNRTIFDLSTAKLNCSQKNVVKKCAIACTIGEVVVISGHFRDNEIAWFRKKHYIFEKETLFVPPDFKAI